MISFKKYCPYPNLPIIAKTKYGMREIIYLPRIGYRYNDCAHPLENLHCNPFDIEEWEYIDEKNMNDLLFRDNWIQRKMEAEDMLATINMKIYLWDKLIYRINSIWSRVKFIHKPKRKK